MDCPRCGEKLFYSNYGTFETLVGYSSPLGHDHDDNCLTRIYYCKSGHSIKLSKRRKCPHPDCDWIGKATCFCHPGKKIDEWPD